MRSRPRRDPYRSGFFTWSDPFAHARLDQGDLSLFHDDVVPPMDLRGAVARAREQLSAAAGPETTSFGTDEAFRSFWSGEGEDQTVEQRFAKILD